MTAIDPARVTPTTRSPATFATTAHVDSSTTHNSCAPMNRSGPSSDSDSARHKLNVLNRLKRKATLTILLIGETGTGKTTFMSLLANLLQGRGALELDDIHVESNESGLSKSQSQTTMVTLYTLATSDGLKIKVLDTPGLADTRGIDQDNKHKAEINRAIKQYITMVDAVLIMDNGSVQRLGAATDYTLNVLTSMFPHSIIENIGLIFTNSDPLTLNFRLESLPIELRRSEYWVIQNPLGLLNNYKMQMNDSARPNSKMLLEKRLEASYAETVETLNDWLEWLDQRPVKPTKEIHELYGESIGIESKIEASLSSSISRLAEQRIIAVCKKVCRP